MVHGLPVTALVTWATASEDNQPLHPGVPQNVGCTLPVLPSSLPHPRSALIAPFYVCCSTDPKQGGSHYDTSHDCKLPGGRQSRCAYAHCHTVHFSLDVPCFLTLTHTHTGCMLSDPPWWLWQPSVRSKRSAQSRTKAHHRRLLRNPLGRVPFLPVCSSRD